MTETGLPQTILLADDEPSIRSLIGNFLVSMGYQILVATSGEEALQIFECHNRAIDLLITDITMPHMSGWELAVRIMRLRPGLKVLYISGYPANESSLEDAPDQGNAFLQKPFTLDALARQVGILLSDSQGKTDCP